MLRFPLDGSESSASKKATMKLKGIFDLKVLQSHGVRLSSHLFTEKDHLVFEVGDRFAVKVMGKKRRVFVRAVSIDSVPCSCGLCSPDTYVILKKAVKPC